MCNPRSCSTYPRYPLSEPTARPFAALAEDNGEKPFSPWDLYQSYSLKYEEKAGTGLTIAVVVAYGNPNLQSDFDAFNRKYALPSAQLELRYSGDGPNKADNRQTPQKWRLEANADVSWIHAVAPGAKLICMAAPDATLSALMQAALLAAEQADIVSMSFGGPELREQTAIDARLAATGKCFVASSGDVGGAVVYPSASDAVISVGGAVFHRNTANGTVFAYTAWENGGGGPSRYTGIPKWQKRFVPIAAMSADKRATPDLALDACQSPGYAVYDGGSESFVGLCGTSIGAPVFSGMAARVMANSGKTASSAEVCEALYALAGTTSYDEKKAERGFYDVLLGSNGRYDAKIGFDFCTGLGVPQGLTDQIFPKN